jgi:hypothetical protein
VIPPSVSDSPRPGLDSAAAFSLESERSGSEKRSFHAPLVCERWRASGDEVKTHAMDTGEGRTKISSSRGDMISLLSQLVKSPMLLGASVQADLGGEGHYLVCGRR